MDKADLRLEVLNQARRLLTEENRRPTEESEDILKLLNILIEAIERSVPSQDAEKDA